MYVVCSHSSLVISSSASWHLLSACLHSPPNVRCTSSCDPAHCPRRGWRHLRRLWHRKQNLLINLSFIYLNLMIISYYLVSLNWIEHQLTVLTSGCCRMTRYLPGPCLARAGGCSCTPMAPTHSRRLPAEHSGHCDHSADLTLAHGPPEQRCLLSWVLSPCPSPLVLTAVFVLARVKVVGDKEYNLDS